MEKRDDEILLDFGKIWEKFKDNWLIFLVVIFTFCAIASIVTVFFIDKSYTAAGKIIVVNQNNDMSVDLSYSDVQLSQKLVSTYVEIIKSELISDIVVDNLHLSLSNQEYNKMLTVGSVGSTEVMEIKIISNNPRLAASMVNEIIDVFIEKIGNIMNVNNVSVLNKAKNPTVHSSPSLIINVAIALVLGVVFSVSFLFMIIVLDTKVKSEEELRAIFDYPIIGKIPDFSTNEKGVYSSERQRKRNNHKK